MGLGHLGLVMKCFTTENTVIILSAGAGRLTLDELEMIGDLLQDGQAGQHQAEGTAQPACMTALRLVSLASLWHSR